MAILVRQAKTGLFLAPNGGWTTEKGEARQFKSLHEAAALVPTLSAPLEAMYEVGKDGPRFTLPLGTPRKFDPLRPKREG